MGLDFVEVILAKISFEFFGSAAVKFTIYFAGVLGYKGVIKSDVFFV